MAQEKAKYSIRQALKQGGIFVDNADIWENNVFKIVVENAGSSNVINILGKINGESGYHLIDSVIGSTVKVIDIQFYDIIRLDCAVYDSPTNYLVVTGSAFNTSSSGSIVGSASAELSLRFDEISSTEMYLAEGLFGALDSEPKWKIKKIVIIGEEVSIKNASTSFDQIWDNRVSLTYV